MQIRISISIYYIRILFEGVELILKIVIYIYDNFYEISH